MPSTTKRAGMHKARKQIKIVFKISLLFFITTPPLRTTFFHQHFLFFLQHAAWRFLKENLLQLPLLLALLAYVLKLPRKVFLRKRKPALLEGRHTACLNF